MTELSKEEREVFEKGWKDFSWGIEDPDDPTCIPLEFFQLGIQTERNKHRWINENKRLKEIIVHARGVVMIGMIILRELNQNQKYSDVLDNLMRIKEILDGKRPLPDPPKGESL